MTRRYTVTLRDTVTGARAVIPVVANTHEHARKKARAAYSAMTQRTSGYRVVSVEYEGKADA
jgi:hypothetical protein